MDLHHGFRAVSVDVITDYAFDNCYNLLDKPSLGAEFFDMLREMVPAFWVFQQFPFLQKLSAMLPLWLLARMSPGMGRLAQLQMVNGSYPVCFALLRYVPLTILVRRISMTRSWL
jgi:hypothetical protein